MLNVATSQVFIPPPHGSRVKAPDGLVRSGDNHELWWHDF